ncbi:MAG: T9SS type A sorting domain-containing protein [Bacteroidota bacterium]
MNRSVLLLIAIALLCTANIVHAVGFNVTGAGSASINGTYIQATSGDAGGGLNNSVAYYIKTGSPNLYLYRATDFLGTYWWIIGTTLGSTNDAAEYCYKEQYSAVATPSGLFLNWTGSYLFGGTATVSTPVIPVTYVNSNASGSNNGSTWANAYTDLQSALTALSGGGTIWIASGTYKPGAGSPTRSSTFSLPSGITIYGGFAGTESSVADRDIASNVTILSGDIGTADVTTDNVYHVVTSSSGDATLDGVTITAGRANGGGANDNGGAVNFTAGTLTIKNSKVTNNYCGFSGGAIYVDANATALNLTNCLFASNTSNNYAGAIGLNAGGTFTNCTFSGNTAFTGGALYVGAATTINNSILWGNTATSAFQVENGSTLNLNYSCYSNSPGDMGGGKTTSNCITSDPLFVGSGSYAIIGNSPCTDAGSDAYNSGSYDIRGSGYARKLNKTSGAVGTIDMGAYEYSIGNEILYVKTGASGSNNGSNWANAYTDLQSALTALSGGGKIWIASGTYKPGAGSPTRSSTFSLPSGITIYGGFAGTESSVADRDIASNVTILSGDIGTADVTTDNVYHVVTSSSGDATLDGVTITAGRANGGGANDNGGAVNFTAGTLTIKNSKVTNNYCGFSGGAIYVDANATALNLTNCLFASNTSNNYAGAIGLNAGGTFTNCTFSGNTAFTGGALYVGAATTINNSILWGNTATSAFQVENGSTLNLNYSCYSNSPGDMGGGKTTSNCITSDPLFVGSGSYAIIGNSPCTDAGSDAYNSGSYDIRGSGYARKLNKTSGAVGTIDMGAYEYKVSVDPLPVELSAFTASVVNNLVSLEWKTATETNNYGFEIERAIDNGQLIPQTTRDAEQRAIENWSKIGFVEGNGTTNAPKSYSFTDKSANGKTSYRLKQIDRDGKFKYSQVIEVTAALPKEFKLEQNYPNPFNPATAINYHLLTPGRTTLMIYDALGREIVTLVDDVKDAGSYTVRFDGTKLSSGFYFAKLSSNGKTQIRKMLMVK